MEIIKNRIVIHFHTPINWALVKDSLCDLKVDYSTQVPQIGMFVVVVDIKTADEILAKLKADPNIRSAMFDVRLDPSATFTSIAPNDSYGNLQYAIKSMHVLEAQKYQKGNPIIKIGVIDTGLNTSHEDFINQNIIVTTNDFDKIHGTTVASCIAPETDNGLGVIGVAPNVTLAVYGTGFANSEIISHIYHAIGNDVPIISASFGAITNNLTGDLEQPIRDFWDSGGLYIMAAGNENADGTRYPRVAECQLFVGAVDSKNSKTWFTNWGTLIDVCSPGERIYSAFVHGGYGYWDGTSASCPHVSAVAGLVLSENKNLTNVQLKSLLKECVDGSKDFSFRKHFTNPDGVGVINALKAVLKARSLRREFKNSLIPIINFLGVPVDNGNISNGILTTIVPQNTTIEVLCYGQKWNENGILKLYHGENLVYSGGVQEYPKVSDGMVIEDGLKFETQSDFSSFSGMDYQVDTEFKYSNNASIKLINNGPGYKYISKSIDLTDYNILAFRINGAVENDWEYKSQLDVLVDDSLVLNIDAGGGMANVLFFNWDQILVDISSFSGVKTIKIGLSIEEAYQDKSMWVDEIIFSDLELPSINVGVSSVTGDLLLVAECNDIDAAYYIPLNGEPRLMTSSVDFSENTVEIASWEGATTYYKWDDGQYTEYSQPLSVQGEVLSYYSGDTVFSETPKVLTIDFDPPLTTAFPLSGIYDKETLIELSEVGQDISQPVSIFYRWNDGTWYLYQSPIPIRTGTLEWYGVDAIGNQESVRSATYQILSSIKKLDGTPAGLIKKLNGSPAGIIKRLVGGSWQ